MLTIAVVSAIWASPLAAAAPAPAQPVVPAATTAPTKAPRDGLPASPGTASPSVTPTPTPSPRVATKPADEDQWVFLAMAVGGGLIGAVILFMLAGGLLRRTGSSAAKRR